MLTASRDDRLGAGTAHVGPVEPSRSLVSRFTGSVQVIGSLVGVPLALLGGYSTYHSTFSSEAKCQGLRTSIVSMLDKQADATTLRLLVQRDVATFQRDCAEVDPDAVAAFKNLLGAERAIARKSEPQPKADAPAVQQAKAEPAPKPAVPVKAEAVAKPEPVKKVQAPAVAKREVEKPAPAAKEIEAKPDAKPAPEIKEAKASEPPGERADTQQVDTVWIASVRDALRESAARPLTIEPPEAALPMPPPIAVSAPPPLIRPAPRIDANAPPRPPADIPMAMPKDERPMPPVPPASIPDAAADATPSQN